MSWVYNGRKYWYHKGKKYSCKFKKRYKSKRRNYNSSSSFEYVPIPSFGLGSTSEKKYRHGNKRYYVSIRYRLDSDVDDRFLQEEKWEFDNINEAKEKINTLKKKHNTQKIQWLQGYDNETNEFI